MLIRVVFISLLSKYKQFYVLRNSLIPPIILFIDIRYKFLYFICLNKCIVKVKRDILTFFVRPSCLLPLQLDRRLMTHIKLKSFKHE